MNTILLSGVGGSTNWLPLIFPLAAALAIAYLIDVLVKYFKKRKLLHENRIVDEYSSLHKEINHAPEAES